MRSGSHNLFIIAKAFFHSFLFKTKYVFYSHQSTWNADIYFVVATIKSQLVSLVWNSLFRMSIHIRLMWGIGSVGGCVAPGDVTPAQSIRRPVAGAAPAAGTRGLVTTECHQTPELSSVLVLRPGQYLTRAEPWCPHHQIQHDNIIPVTVASKVLSCASIHPSTLK